jgi:hypothetical protein
MGRKSKELLVITLLLNLAAFGWYGFLFSEIKKKNEHISDLTNRIEAEASRERAIAYKRDIVTDTVSFRGKLRSLTLQKGGEISFLELLEKSGDTVGARASVESVTTRSHPQLESMTELRLKLKAEGSWSAVVRFLGLMEFIPLESALDQLVVSKAERGGGVYPWRADFILIVLRET